MEHGFNSFAVAYTFSRRGDAEGAAILMAATEALREKIGYTPMPFLIADYQHFRQITHEMLGDSRFEALWKIGSEMSVEATLDFATNRPLSASTSTSASTSQPSANESDALATRARALSAAGRLASHGDDVAGARRLALQGVEAARQSGETSSFVYAVAAFTRMAMTTGDAQSDIAQSLLLSAEAMERARAANARPSLLEALQASLYARTVAGDLEGALSLQNETLALARERATKRVY